MKFFLIPLLFLSPVYAKFDKTKIQNLKHYIEKSIKEWNIPGVAIGIIQDGKVYFESGFGVRELGKSEEVDNHTVFSIASGTKPFLVHLTAHLVDKGILKWDDPVRKYRPDFFVGNEETSKIFTIRDLLSHRSGLRNFAADTLWDLGFSKEDIQKGIAKLPLYQTFRKTFAYQNHFFGTMTLIIEKITGKTIHQLFQEILFTPLRMEDSSAAYEYVASTWQTKLKEFMGIKRNLASPHHTLFRLDGTNKNVIPIPHNSFLFTYPGSSGVNTSLHDLNQWILFLMNENQKLISKEFRKQIFTPHVDVEIKEEDSQFPSSRISNIQYGMGMFMQDYGTEDKKIRLMSHMGASGGWRAYYGFCPKEKFGFVIMCNLGTIRINLFPEALRSYIMDQYMDLPVKDWSHDLYETMVKNRKKFIDEFENEKKQFPRPHTSLSVLSGKYENDFYGTLEVSSKNNQLVFSYQGKDIQTEHFNGDRFSFDSYNLSPFWNGYDPGFIEFGEKDGQNVCYISQMNESDNPLFKKVS